MTTTYRITSDIYCGGGVLSTHRTLSGASRAIRKHDAAIDRLNRHGGRAYHDCEIEELQADGSWRTVGAVLA